MTRNFRRLRSERHSSDQWYAILDLAGLLHHYSGIYLLSRILALPKKEITRSRIPRQSLQELVLCCEIGAEDEHIKLHIELLPEVVVDTIDHQVYYYSYQYSVTTNDRQKWLPLPT